jgi:hypothetical protein
VFVKNKQQRLNKLLHKQQHNSDFKKPLVWQKRRDKLRPKQPLKEPQRQQPPLVRHGLLHQHLPLYPLPRQYNRRKGFSQGHNHKFLSNLHLHLFSQHLPLFNLRQKG